ncbi:unnamed protein product [Laminaria digitata]
MTTATCGWEVLLICASPFKVPLYAASPPLICVVAVVDAVVVVNVAAIVIAVAAAADGWDACEGGRDQGRPQQGQRSGDTEHPSPPRGSCQRPQQLGGGRGRTATCDRPGQAHTRGTRRLLRRRCRRAPGGSR